MRRVVLAALMVTFAQNAAQAAVSCPNRASAPISGVAAAGRKCQAAMVVEGGKFLRAKMAILTACKLKQPPGGCPTVSDSDRLLKVVNKATTKIAAACGDDAAQAALPSSYNTGTDPAVISSCMLSQHNVIGEYVAANAVGPTIEPMPGGNSRERTLCIKEVALRGRLAAASLLANAVACIGKQIRLGTPGDLAPICVGSYTGGVLVPPTDAMTAAKQAKIIALTEAKLTKKCAFVETTDAIQSMFGCAGSETVADLQQCVLCSGFDAAVDALEQQYSETGEFVAHGPAPALQTAVTNASPGDKLLIGSGTYVEEVDIAIGKDNLQIVGCGGASDARPVISAPAVEVSGRGFQAANVDGLVFQSLTLVGQDNDGIRVALCDGVTFRDIVGDGNLESAYSVFPQTCNNVLVELCKVTRVNDAPLYVGQSSGIIVRHNEVRDSVAGIEIENCGSAEVYGNFATGNTAGILVFKDGSLPVQMSQCHHVHHNVNDDNNTPNFGSGTVAAVPTGTGMLIISNDKSSFHHNIARNHDTFGIAFSDQVFAMFNVGPDPDPELNYFFNNLVTGNGDNSHFVIDEGPPVQTLGGDGIALGSVPFAPLGNCQVDNVFTDLNNSLVNNMGVCTLPVPAFVGCPAPPVP